jgi:magnesium chelatase subunit H
MSPEERDQKVLEIYERLLEIERRLIPIGLHVFGRAPGNDWLESLAVMVASFDRMDESANVTARALTDLVAEGLGLPPYSELVRSRELLSQRELVEGIVRQAVSLFLSSHSAERAASFLLERASVDPERASAMLAVLAQLRDQLEANAELDALVRALKGGFIEPGPGADIVQNPDVLPTGRNIHAVNPYAIPSPDAERRAALAVKALLDRCLQESGGYPEAMAMVLWGSDNIKTGGEAVAQALQLLGVAPRRDGLNRAVGLQVLPIEKLGRPRIDVVMTVSGIFRDLFRATSLLLDKAVRAVAALEEPEDFNYVRRHVQAAIRDGLSFDEAATRVFSNAPGNYGTNVDLMVASGEWEEGAELGNLFMARKCFAYGAGLEGLRARHLLERALARVQLTYQCVDSAEIGISDVDHYFEYLGGVSKAVEVLTGSRPRIYLSDVGQMWPKVRALEEAIRLESRTKLLNPKWYEGMLKHGFSGVAQIERRVRNTFGWSATANAVDDWIYGQIARTFVFDREMFDRLRSLNPNSARSLVGRLIEASGRGFWSAPESELDQLREALERLEDQLEGIGLDESGR